MLALIAAGIAFAVYPILRGSAVETGFSAAELYARPAWLLAHSLGMIGFIASAWGLLAVDRWAGRLAFGGTLLVLPYYGAEAFGLNAIGRLAVQLHDPSGVAAADMFRYQPVAMTAFAAGLLLVAAAGVRLLLLLRHRPMFLRVGLTITGLGLLTYLPQFFVPIEGRIADGIVLGIGLVLLAMATANRQNPGR
ncbi:hypothetical protein [Microlunatus sp. Gsoil 973]|uniref:hypothetical protein n=1 Tax=Microlunatus sp. Gsoil 973 TaxID=2672569 RepID=UPI0012B4D065|nr:hypothetical protein [Microlunatus sp. Gsoil 973]QGN33970.1 hypothetical protein GJV80_15370 [Microlunatus sp. Gsoil 973]